MQLEKFIKEEETGPAYSIRIQVNNKLESKTNELEGKPVGANHDSFTEQASEMFDKVFKKSQRNQKYKQRIQCHFDKVHKKI